MSCHVHLPVLAATLLGLAGCDVYPVGPGPTGIADFSNLPDNGCGRGFLISSSDYQSSNISAINWQGHQLTPSLVSSGLTAAGLVQAFSGDVVLPTERQLGSEALIIDRYPQSVLSFVTLATAEIRKQIDVSTGFAANPRDALRLEDGRILVTRFDSNLDLGRNPYDAGGDLVVVDQDSKQVRARIDLRPATLKATDILLPHPDRMLRHGNVIYVVVPLYSHDYQTTGASYLVSLDSKTLGLIGSLELTGLKGCSGLSLSPDSAELAIACFGNWLGDEGSDPETSGLVGLDITAAPIERWRLLATSLSPSLPFGFSVAYANHSHVVAVALGHLAEAGQSAESDRFVSYDVKTKAVETIYVERGTPFSLGDVSCLSPCGSCALANANGRGEVMLFEDNGAQVKAIASFPSDPQLGLPPRWLGTF